MQRLPLHLPCSVQVASQASSPATHLHAAGVFVHQELQGKGVVIIHA
jgi:hypothetical protein